MDTVDNELILLSLLFYSGQWNVLHSFQILAGDKARRSPISFLFVLMTEGLGRTLKAMPATNRIKGLSLHNGVQAQTHQQFVYDTMLMGQSSVQEAKVMKKGLDRFLQASDLYINNEKSKVYLFNTP